MTINEPSLDINKDTATLAWEKSVTEATNRMQHQIDNINESVNVPSNLIAIYAKTQDGQGQQFTPYSDGAGFIAHVAYTDTLPTLPVTGATFSAYSDTVVDTIIKQYIEQNARPTNPGTTSYQVSGAVWSSSVGWTKTKLTRAGINVWFSEARIIGTAGTTVVAKWSNPKLLFGGAIANGILYYNVASTGAPSAPTADGYDYDSGVFNNLTSGWQYTPITAAMGGGTTISHKHWQVTFQVETDEVTNSQIITFGTVEGVIPIGADLQSDTYSAGSAGWKIERGTGNAEFNNITARGNITAESITSGTLSVDRIGTNAIGMTKLTNDIQSLNYSSGSAGWRIRQSGAAEFNGVVISRQLVAASGTFSIPSTAIVPLGIYHLTKTYYINVAGLGTTPWVNTTKTFVGVAGITGASVSAPTSAVPNVDWGWQCDIILNTTWGGGTGTPAFTGVVLKVNLYTRNVNNIQGTLQWKVFEVV
tara:strand:- start:564 stop:1991 length:1428 start_codon:yes stop_codon:yes gene_type:complete